MKSRRPDVLSRRRFLQGIGLAGLASAIQLPFAALASAASSQSSVSSNGASYKVNGTGRIWVSRDGGKSWVQHSNLGSIYSISTIRKDAKGAIRIDVAYKGGKFPLALASDLRTWRTA